MFSVSKIILFCLVLLGYSAFVGSSVDYRMSRKLRLDVAGAQNDELMVRTTKMTLAVASRVMMEAMGMMLMLLDWF